ncbi:MAG: PhoD-like phosphatase N-terminal domain-containing protein, partial [Planctomycetota bacterium]
MSGYRIRRILSAACAGAFVCVFLVASHAAEAGREGAKRSGKAAPPKEKSIEAQPYKARNREQISRIIDGKAGAVVEELSEHLAKYPDDAESLFVLAVAYCQTGDVPQAVDAMHRALAAGLPLERFVAGPRKLLEPLTGSEAFGELRRGHDFQLIHGPMVGCVTDSSAKIWLRTAEEVPIQVILSDSADMSRPLRSATVFTEADRDYTAVVELERLAPDTVYHYDLLIRGKPVLGPKLPSFRTFPRAEASARFQVGFGGGAGYTPWNERVWNTVASRGLAAFLFLGDNVYIDTPTKPEVQRYCYYRRQSRPEYRRFVASTPIFAIWDDHDFGTNDCWYGPEINDPPWKPAVWRVFTENWNNPGYGGGRRQPGCWFRFQIA